MDRPDSMGPSTSEEMRNARRPPSWSLLGSDICFVETGARREVDEQVQ